MYLTTIYAILGATSLATAKLSWPIDRPPENVPGNVIHSAPVIARSPEGDRKHRTHYARDAFKPLNHGSHTSPRAEVSTFDIHAQTAVPTEAPQTNFTRGPKNPADDPRFVPFGCGTNPDQHASADLIAVHKALYAEQNGKGGAPPAKFRIRSLRARDDTVEIEVFIHVVTTKAKEGSIGKDVPQKQIDAMNNIYNATGFSFTLKDSDFTTNDIWAVGATDDDILAMKTALRKGTYSTLNLYFHTDLAGSVLGVCTMPSDITDPNHPSANVDPSSYVDDGCSVNAGTMPGGTIYGYTQGMTAAHETGHWLGLFHVFEGYTCDGDGDLIIDTAPQKQSTDGCPVATASCPGNLWRVADMGGAALPLGVKDGDPMLDNIHNVMDYSTDACYTGFTRLQIQRMKDLWGMFRKGK